MTATLEWDCIPFTFTTPQGSLLFNTADQLGAGLGGFYLLRRDICRMGAPLRPTVTDRPAADGAVVHKTLTSGYRVTLGVDLFEHSGVDGEPGSVARGETLVGMTDLLMRHLNRIREPGGGRLQWNPSGDGHAERMVDDLFWTEDAEAEDDTTGLWTVTLGLASPFPYAEDAQETVTAIADGASASLDNTGSARFWPVVKAYGPTSEFTITNVTSGLSLHYDSAQPGASAIGGAAYVELDHFRDTAYLNGDAVSRVAGIDLDSSYFPLEIGVNEIAVDGCDIDVLWQSAWA